MREITELAAVAAIRTALNFFLASEIRQERRELADGGHERKVDPADVSAGHLA